MHQQQSNNRGGNNNYASKKTFYEESVLTMHTRMDKIENLLSSIAENITSANANQHIINNETNNRELFMMKTLKAVQEDLKLIIPIKQIANVEENLLCNFQMNEYAEFFQPKQFFEYFNQFILLNDNMIEYM